MVRWSRWQDWVVSAAGCYAVLSPLWIASIGVASEAVLVLGVACVLVALWSLRSPGAMGAEVLLALLGALLFFAPVLVGFASATAMAWTARILGVVIFLQAASSVPESRAVHHDAVIAEWDHDKPPARPAPQSRGHDEGLLNTPGRTSSTRMDS